MSRNLYIPYGYENFESEEDSVKNHAYPSLFNFSTQRYLSINEVWNVLNASIYIRDLEIVIKPKKVKNNNDMHQDW